MANAIAERMAHDGAERMAQRVTNGIPHWKR